MCYICVCSKYNYFLNPVYTIKVFIPNYLSAVNSKTNKIAELDLDSKNMFWLVNSHQSLSKFLEKIYKIGFYWVKSVKVHQSSLTKFLMQVYRIKELVKVNFDQVFDEKLWLSKLAFIHTLVEMNAGKKNPSNLTPCYSDNSPKIPFEKFVKE